eukprot:58181_1
MQSFLPEEKILVAGYFQMHFDKQTPIDIINQCILYCFLLDKFDAKASSNIKVNYIQNSITLLHPFEPSIACTRNNIRIPEKYHWIFEISVTQETVIRISYGSVHFNHDCIMFRELNPILAWTCYNDKTTKFHIYLDAGKQLIHARAEAERNCSFPRTILIADNDDDAGDNFRLQIIFTGPSRSSASIRLADYYDSTLYKREMERNPQNAFAHMEMARHIHDNAEKMTYCLKALKINPFFEKWHEEYLLYLLARVDSNKFDVAFKHCIRFKKGIKVMVLLIKRYDKQLEAEYPKSYQLFSLLNDQQLLENDLFWEFADCLSLRGQPNAALKYYKKYLQQHTNEDNDCMKIIYYKIARTHFDNDEYNEALAWFLKLDEETVNKCNLHSVHDEIAYCYYKLNDL